jgi:hypothetical protein
MTLTTPAPERYSRFSCPNPHCARFNRPGEGNIAHRSWTGTHKHIERLRCTVCDREFSEREGTWMARSKLPEDTVIRLVQCQRWGVCEEGTADICAGDLKTVHWSYREYVWLPVHTDPVLTKQMDERLAQLLTPTLPERPIGRTPAPRHAETLTENEKEAAPLPQAA